ncbi:serine/threonine-protein kinase/endoribonuclease IRE1 [Neocloeon triangulifer]|uniref:serine/threonine-protein kinase/endoribonuclease IRE1 n=1 Tax=Neocloeon triangulifer TaxID=2078957 RepID=UPI00286EDCB2|nr:serine/threonine-protein kinase/endoribonuclease IRE1 [Neocloeon triangulifer]
MSKSRRKLFFVFNSFAAFLVLQFCWAICVAPANAHNVVSKIGSTELLHDNPLIFVSTLGGSLIAVEQKTGDVRWKILNDPAVKVPVDKEKAIASPLFLPDPKDGSLYMLGTGIGGYESALKKLPFTIPQLVASSPCRSTDGILYTGRKVASWMAVDADTGRKHQVIGHGQDSIDVCPADGARTIYIGRTEYSIAMFDSIKKEKRWNVTFFDYTAGNLDAADLENYEFAHFATNSGGRVVTLERDSGRTLWENEFESPVIAMYLLQDDSLFTIPFTTVGVDTLKTLQSGLTGTDTKLLPSLYVGQFPYGLYALPSLIDNSRTPTLAAPPKILLIEGPKHNSSYEPDVNDYRSDEGERPPSGKTPNSNPFEILLGHYQLPEYSKTQLQITGKSKDPVLSHPDDFIIRPNGPQAAERVSISIQTDSDDALRLLTELKMIWGNITNGNISANIISRIVNLSSTTASQFVQRQGFMTFIILVLSVFVIIILFMVWSLYKRMRDIQEQQLSNQQFSTGSRGSKTSQESESDPLLDEQDGSIVRIGKIELIPNQVLGRGCEGTFVFHGRFEGRPVAVKRLLPECFTVADREVDLLRESDEHPNVIRYFCTEKDRQFRYIALELCKATLEDFVLGKFNYGVKISEADVLLQATSGLAHLHSLDIVHRDIKPHNVLLSYPNAKGEIKAMISDFGLCKKLQRGRHSFSHRSGIAGTDGWIAPEMINPEKSATCSVDIFSMGCVFYYVLSKGKHPFGDTLRRQANILCGEAKLEVLEDKEFSIAFNLVEAMIAIDPTRRPTASAVIKHPFFWDAAKRLTFLQDVSDRVESDEFESPVLQALETKNWVVVQRDWRKHVGEEIAADLRKYRNYRGSSVRDLLRALRNKKHHYRDLAEEAKKVLGTVPKEFLEYFTKRFPLLFIHTWLAMECVRQEPGMHDYYDESYVFPQNISALVSAVDEPADRHDNASMTNSPKDWNSAWATPVKKNNKKRSSPHPAWSLNWRQTQQNNDGNNKENLEASTDAAEA